MQTHTHTLSSGMNHIASLKQSFHSFCKLQNSSVVTYLYPCKTLGPAILYGSILRVLFWILKKYHVYIFNSTRTNAHWKRHCLRLYSGNKDLYLIPSLTHNSVQLHGLPKAIQSQQKSVMFTLNCTSAVLSYSAPEWTLMFFEFICPHSHPGRHRIGLFIVLQLCWQQRHSFYQTAQDDSSAGPFWSSSAPLKLNSNTSHWQHNMYSLFNFSWWR